MKMQMDMPYVVAVVITGLVVVFLGLVLLIAFITVVGKIFEKIDKAKAAEKAAEQPPAPKAVSAMPVVQTAASGSDSDEIIAVISAAVAMMSAADGKPYRVKSVKPVSGKSSSRSAWAAAGLRDYTNPF